MCGATRFVAQMTGAVLEWRLGAQDFGAVRLLDVVGESIGSRNLLFLFFDGPIGAEAVVLPQDATLIDTHAIVGGTVFCFDVPSLVTPLPCVIAGRPVTILPAGNEQGWLADTNALLAVRNGEPVAVVLDWLQFHARFHGLTGAVILDRAPPEKTQQFALALDQAVKERGIDSKVVILAANAGLGQAGLPPETDPYCVPEAPGKDRMTVPPPDPWHAPLGAIIWYEIARCRFLQQARAVANVDVHDLILPDKGSVFDMAVDSESGLVVLRGRHCFPWRVRDGSAPAFGDHICVQFDTTQVRKRWCTAPAKTRAATDWRMIKVSNIPRGASDVVFFDRHMALRHRADKIAKLVPKAALVEDAALVQRATGVFAHKPVRAPSNPQRPAPCKSGRSVIVTTMKNEGPFILEWLAFHVAVGFTDFLVYSNDCTDGTDTLLELLMEKGWVTHRDNPFRKMDLRPQHAALRMAEGEPLVKEADWVACIDVDEFVNIKVGDGTLSALFEAVPDANLISMTWRLFGNAGQHAFVDAPVIAQFTRCAPEFTRKPHQAWGFKTLFANAGLFRKLGVHRPKGFHPSDWQAVNWVNGSGRQMPASIYRNGWRSTVSTYGYDIVQLNHYAVRSVESFLVKRDRGRVNHVERDQGLAYWFRMNNNADTDCSILQRRPQMQAVLERLLADPEIAEAHAACVESHRRKIRKLRQVDDFAALYETLASTRMEALSQMHGHFGANVFLGGPEAIPDEIAGLNPNEEWFFTVERADKTAH